jgi:hypothetical protein
MCAICDTPQEELIDSTFIICSECNILKEIPKELVKLQALWCFLINISEIPKELVNLVELNCSICFNLKEIPKELVNLMSLNCFRCTLLKEIPKELVNLKLLNCVESMVKNIPRELVNLIHLWCDCTNIEYIPKELTKLSTLCISNCLNIKEIPKELINLVELNCDNCPNIVEIHNFKNLKLIACYNCPKLTFAPTHLIKNQVILNIIESNYQKYRKEACKKLVFTILEELIQKTWEPKRARDWCWDEEEKKFMNGMFY